MPADAQALSQAPEFLASTRFLPVREQVRKFAHAVEDETGWLVARNGRELVNPIYLATYLWWPAGFYVRRDGEEGHFEVFRRCYPDLAQSPNLYARAQCRLHAPFALGSSIEAHLTLHSRYQKRGRDYAVLHARFVDQHDAALADFHYTIALRSRPGIAEVAAQPKADDASAAKPVPAERPTPLLTRTVTMSLEKARLFHLPVEDHHTHDHLAQARGMPKATPSTTMALAYAARMCEQHFGGDWLDRGDLQATFLRSFLRDDVLTLSAWRADTPAGEPHRGDGLELSLVDARGNTVLAARAGLTAS